MLLAFPVFLCFTIIALVWVTLCGAYDAAVARSGRRALQFGIASCGLTLAAFVAMLSGLLLISVWLVLASLVLGACHLLWFGWLVLDVRRSPRSQSQLAPAQRPTKE